MAETYFNFKEALENVNQPQTIEEEVDDFLRFVYYSIKKQNINSENISAITFRTYLEKDSKFTVVVECFLHNEECECERIVSSTMTYDYDYILLFFKTLEDKLTKEGLKCLPELGNERITNSMEIDF